MNGKDSNHNIGSNGHNGHSKSGPKTPEGRARALANLKPAKPGEVRNPNGRPNAGASVREWWNQMEGWPRAKLKAVIDNQESPVAKVAAAQRWLDGCTLGNELERIIEHTGGKAVARIGNADGSNIELAPIVLDGDREL